MVELKRIRPRDSLETVRARGIAQIGAYLGTLGAAEGWLLLFDVRPARSWEERLWREEVDVDGRKLHLLGA